MRSIGTPDQPIISPIDPDFESASTGCAECRGSTVLWYCVTSVPLTSARPGNFYASSSPRTGLALPSTSILG